MSTLHIVASIFILAWVAEVHAIDLCHQHDNCVDCTESSRFCKWNSHSLGRCVERFAKDPEGSTSYLFDDTCPANYAPESDFLANWMGELMPILGDSTLLDISLPGTHDTLTHDLSTTVSEGGMDDLVVLAEFMHNYTSKVPDGIEDFIRKQAQTQDMGVSEQLNAGVRFFDFRIMQEYSDADKEWYSLHMVQSRETAAAYFMQVREWMDAHPSEVVVLWVSKHGNNCNTGQEQYPNVTTADKQLYYQQILSIFDGIVVDFSETRINETSIATMVQRNHRVVLYMSDYAEMTGGGGAQYSLDGCDVDNDTGCPGVYNVPDAVKWQRDTYATAAARKAEDKKSQKFFLVSSATGGKTTQIVSAAIMQFVPSTDKHNQSQVVQKCAESINIPFMTEWCPETLLDLAQLDNYYSQIAFEDVVAEENASWDLPHAIYINGLDRRGTIRTGTQVLWGGVRNAEDKEHWKSAYAYVDTFLLVNARHACSKAQNAGKLATCAEMKSRLQARRSLFPAARWEDETHGRSTTWPV